MSYQTILYAEDGPIGTITLNRPDDGNMFNETMCHEVRDCINAIRRETRTRVGLFDLTMTERARAEYPLDAAASRDVDVIVGQVVSGLHAVLADGGIGPDAVLGQECLEPGAQRRARPRVHQRIDEHDEPAALAVVAGLQVLAEGLDGRLTQLM